MNLMSQTLKKVFKRRGNISQIILLSSYFLKELTMVPWPCGLQSSASTVQGTQPSPWMLPCQRLGLSGSDLASQQHTTQYLLLLWRSLPQKEAGLCHPLPRTVRKWHGSVTSASYRSSHSPGSPNNVCTRTRSLHWGAAGLLLSQKELWEKVQGSALIWWPDSFIKHGFTLGIRKSLSLHPSSAHRTI